MAEMIIRESSEKHGWAWVPMPGALVRSSHPQTVLNPDKEFAVLEVKFEDGRFYVRGEKTCWFGLGMVTPVLTEDGRLAIKEAALSDPSPPDLKETREGAEG
ncbi:hypothetical protein CIW48_27355 [Methylobacterium sp. P1-11]|uniref:hypothetical protein n=1 Tax=Methylobacterium sp. P1-11 TaxID=2024616 RepID=UPI0011EC24E1|nr:hypothetical protein [Methylobacterium sp. P1-11]KAA0117920.1 hypothetical protein CIW48_27355 [Methylobacterium sp. P1-11]